MDYMRICTGICIGDDKMNQTAVNKPAIEGGAPVRETKIYYGHQYIDDADVREVSEVLKYADLTC